MAENIKLKAYVTLLVNTLTIQETQDFNFNIELAVLRVEILSLIISEITTLTLSNFNFPSHMNNERY